MAGRRSSYLRLRRRPLARTLRPADDAGLRAVRSWGCRDMRQWFTPLRWATASARHPRRVVAVWGVMLLVLGGDRRGPARVGDHHAGVVRQHARVQARRSADRRADRDPHPGLRDGRDPAGRRRRAAAGRRPAAGRAHPGSGAIEGQCGLDAVERRRPAADQHRSQHRAPERRDGGERDERRRLCGQGGRARRRGERGRPACAGDRPGRDRPRHQHHRRNRPPDR